LFAHLGNLLISTRLQNLITFLVDLRRPIDPFEMPLSRYSTRIFKERVFLTQAYHLSKL